MGIWALKTPKQLALEISIKKKGGEIIQDGMKDTLEYLGCFICTNRAGQQVVLSIH